MAETSTNVSDSSAPLLLPSQGSTARSNTISLLLGRATGHRGPSNLVRETAALQLDERRADWGYSKPVVAIDIAWNLASTDVSVVLLASTFKERPNTPIRVWLCGYALQCLVHAILVWLEYRRRTMRRNQSIEDGIESSDSDLDDSEDDVGGYRIGNRWSVAKRCKSVNTVASFLWWILGFYWVVSGGEILSQNAPHLYWLAVIFLAFDVFFAMVCVLLACMIGIALCCCLPCIIAILYAMADQEGATESDIKFLPKYSYKKNYSNEEKPSAGAGSMVPIETTSGDLPDEHVILPEDAECCICLNSYEDGAELHVLPCSHHFHATCVVKWLKINASCPLCKYNILKGNHEQV